MVNYNIDILKKNILELMDKQNITQSKLSEETGIHQPFISKVLSCKDKSCFTIQQLIEIASFFHVSIDSLLGITVPEEQHSEKSLADVLEKLFEVDEDFSIEIKEQEIDSETEFDDFLGEPIKEIKQCVYFKNPYINNVLKEWKELKAHTKISESTQKKLLNLWKEDVLKANAMRFKKWNYKTKEEYGPALASLLLSNPPTGPFSLLPNEENSKILEDYISNGAWLTHSPTELEILYDCIEKYKIPNKE